MGVVIELKDLEFSYHRTPVLEHVNLSISGDHLIGMIGKNGTGKTTLLNLMSGEFEEEKGAVMVEGKSPCMDIEVKRKIAYLHAGITYPKGCNLSYILSMYQSVYEKFDEEFARRLFEYFEIQLNRSYRVHSLGIQSLIRAIFTLATRAPLTLLDEPVIGMDIEVRNQFYDILLRDFMEYPRTIIISSHMLNEMEHILDEMILIKNHTVFLHSDMESIKNSIYQVEANNALLDQIVGTVEVKEDHRSLLGGYVCVESGIGEMLKREYGEQITLSRRRVSDICVDLLKENQGREMDKLWERTK